MTRHANQLEVLIDQARRAPHQAAPLLPLITSEMEKMEAKGEKVLDSYDELVSLDTAKATDWKDKLDEATQKLSKLKADITQMLCAIGKRINDAVDGGRFVYGLSAAHRAAGGAAAPAAWSSWEKLVMICPATTVGSLGILKIAAVRRSSRGARVQGWVTGTKRVLNTIRRDIL